MANHFGLAAYELQVSDKGCFFLNDSRGTDSQDCIQELTVSIISVCLNDQEGLRSTIESALAQRDPLAEIIVVDGGSSDGTVELLKRICMEHRQVSFISEPDDGIYHAMNKGIDMASGRIVTFLNAGDRFHDNDVLNRVKASWRESQWTWAYGCARVVCGTSIVGIKHMIPFRQDHLALGMNSIPHQAAFFTDSMIRALGRYRTDFGLSADQEFMLRASLIDRPMVWADFIVDFDNSGIGSHRPPTEFPIEMRRARKSLGITVARNRPTTSLLAASVMASKLVGHVGSRLRRRLAR